jgi:hypothetical protein
MRFCETNPNCVPYISYVIERLTGNYNLNAKNMIRVRLAGLSRIASLIYAGLVYVSLATKSVPDFYLT